LGAASLILSLAAWPLTYAGGFPGIIAGVLAVVFGAICFNKQGSQKGLGIAGFVIGLMYLLLAVLGLCMGIGILIEGQG